MTEGITHRVLLFTLNALQNNEQQFSACHPDANMKYQTYSSSSLQVFY